MYSFFKNIPFWAQVAIYLGIVLRIREYLSSRPLWLDEAAFALSIIQRSFWELVQQVEPVYSAAGFFLLEKISVLVFGGSEMSLRLFPLIAGIISIILFYKVAKLFLNNKTAIFAIFIFSILDSLIYFSAEVKQYSFDVLVALIIYYIVLSTKSKLLWILVGSLSIWFSHPAIFILAGIGLTITVSYLWQRNWQKFAEMILIQFFWLFSFGLSFFLTVKLGDNQELISFWNFTYAPAPASLDAFKWYFDAIVNFMINPTGLSYPRYGLLVILLGSVFLFRKNKFHLAILIFPFILTLLASFLHTYPFIGRFLLFLIPAALILFAQGADWVGQFVVKLLKVKWIWIGVYIFMAIIFFHKTIILDINHLTKPRQDNEDMESVVKYFKLKQKEGDLVYLYYAGAPAFRYYSNKHGIDVKYILGISAREQLVKYAKDVEKFKGVGRIWFVFSHVAFLKGIPSVTEEQFFVSKLNRMGARLDEFHAMGASIYLYELD